MASNYVSWAEGCVLTSLAEAARLREVFSLGDLDDAESISQTLADKYGIQLSLQEGESFPGFEAEFSDREVTLYSSESGNIEACANIMQAFLKKFQPNNYFKIEWAITCSKMRPEEFGGGACFVTANEIKWMTTRGFIFDLIAKRGVSSLT